MKIAAGIIIVLFALAVILGYDYHHNANIIEGIIDHGEFF